MSDEPLTIEDEIAHDAYSNLILCMMKDADTARRVAEIKSMPPMEAPSFDGERYKGQECTIAMDVHMVPGLVRFQSLCQALASGFKAASRPPVDVDLAKRNWIAACLALMSESVLKSPKNDWKVSLTEFERQLTLPFVAKVIEDMMLWVVAFESEVHPLDPDDGGGLYASIYNAIIHPYGSMTDERGFSINLDGDIFFKTTVRGNLVVNDGTFSSLLAGCEARDAVGKYRERLCPTECRGELLKGNLGADFDHNWRCSNSNQFMRLAQDYLQKRLRAYLDAQDDIARRTALTLGSYVNPWRNYYLCEYCTPTPYHLERCNKDIVDVNIMEDGFQHLNELSANVCNMVIVGSDGSDDAIAMRNAWLEIRALFKQRGLDGAEPPYAKQQKFATLIDAFMEKFDAAVATMHVKRVAPGTGTGETPAEPENSADAIMLGDWAREEVVSKVEVDETKRTITFKGNKGGEGISCSVPLSSNGPWVILRGMLESTDPGGWFQVPERDRYRWRQQFYRKNENRDLKELLAHIRCKNDQGDRGPTMIRLERRRVRKAHKNQEITNPSLG